MGTVIASSGSRDGSRSLVTRGGTVVSSYRRSAGNGQTGRCIKVCNRILSFHSLVLLASILSRCCLRCSFCACALAGLPFATLDEPLYLVYSINRTLQLRAGAALAGLKAAVLGEQQLPAA